MHKSNRSLHSEWLVIVSILAVMFAGESFGRVVETEGLGYNRDGAIQAALRSAVEECAGVSISSNTLVENYTTVSDKILTNASGYVSTYSVTSESSEFGLVKVMVKADVSLGKLENDLSAQKLLYELHNRPRIMVVLDERMEDKEMHEKTATHKLEVYLLSRGFIVIEPEQFEKIRSAESEKDLASMSFREGADLIIRGEVSVGAPSPVQIYGTQFYSVPAQINARIVRSDNAQIITSKTKRIKKNSRDGQSGAEFGLEVGGTELAQELVGDLNEYWKSEAYNENRVDLIVDGCNEADLKSVETTFKGFPFTRDVRLRFLENKSALYDLDMRGTIQEVRAALGKDNRLGLSIVELTANRIVLKKGSSVATVTGKTSDAAIDIAGLTIQDIFPSRLKYYESNPVAGVTLRCGDKGVNNVKVSVIIPEVMDLPAEKRIDRLQSSADQPFPMSLVLDAKKVLSVSENRTVYGKATINCTVGGRSIQRELTAPVKIYDKNAMDWNDLDAIGGFVTFRAPVVTDLAAMANRAVAASTGEINNDLSRGMALFETMRALGISYVKDPTALPGAGILDRVQYPQETIERLGGDCDDLSTLYSALLSALDIHAAIISYPDHVMVMFDTKIFEKNRLSLSSDSINTISYNGTLWIPVEVTMLGKSFVESWHSAALEFHDAISDKQNVQIVDLDSAWQKYPPVQMPEYKKQFSFEKISGAVKKGLLCLEDSIKADIGNESQRLETVMTKGKEKNQPSDFNRLGVLDVHKNKMKDAISLFEKAMDKDNSPHYANNRACALLLAGEEEKALKNFNDIYKTDPSGHIAVNRALCLFVMASTPAGVDEFVKALNEARTMIPGDKSLQDYLGLDLEDILSSSKGDEQVSPSKKQEVNLRRLKELIRSRVLTPEGQKGKKLSGTSSETSSGIKVSGTTSETSSGVRVDNAPAVVLPFGGIRGADPEQVEKVRDLLYWFE